MAVSKIFLLVVMWCWRHNLPWVLF